MVRRHGWQLPLHKLQVLAIVIFCCLVVAFYTVLAPFLGGKGLVSVVIVFYSLLALAVLFLFIRCATIDPGDQGLLIQRSGLALEPAIGGKSYGHHVEHPWMAAKSVSASSSAFLYQDANRYFREQSLSSNGATANDLRQSFLQVARSPCMWFSNEDNCKRDIETPLIATDEAGVQNCALCNKNVFKTSKHCNSCDKCVYGFDHHCRWLNNCIGKKNYKTFMVLMVACLMLLLMEGGTGLAVFVRCFSHNEGMAQKIKDTLGNKFSKGSLASVVAICSVASLLASAAVGELLIFHILLIRKGISTYEYIIAMKALREQFGISDKEESHHLPVSSTSSKSFPHSGSKGWETQYGRGWCTPRRIFVDEEHQEEVTHLSSRSLSSTFGPDAIPHRSSSKPHIKISPWKLARLKSSQAARIVAQTREAPNVEKHFPGNEERLFPTLGDRSCGSSLKKSNERSYYLLPLPAEGKYGLRNQACTPASHSRYLESEVSPIQISKDMRFGCRIPRQLLAETSSSLSAANGLLSIGSQEICGYPTRHSKKAKGSIRSHDNLHFNWTSTFVSSPHNISATQREINFQQ